MFTGIPLRIVYGYLYKAGISLHIILLRPGRQSHSYGATSRRAYCRHSTGKTCAAGRNSIGAGAYIVYRLPVQYSESDSVATYARWRNKRLLVRQVGKIKCFAECKA